MIVVKAHKRKGRMVKSHSRKGSVAYNVKKHEMHLSKKDPKKPLGPGNWYWKESFSNKDPAKYQREWRKRNPEKSKNSNLKKHFGITIEDYNKMGEAQKWKCDICGDLETSKDKDGGPRQMPVDHCHKTGKIRALLCTRCNRGLVLFKDDPALLRAAESYLQKHK